MLDDFILRALLVGFGLALVVGPLGCFVIWRRMAYFGDATSHAALLGVTLAVALNISIYIGVIAVALLIALSFTALSDRTFGNDTVLGVTSHSALALGLVGASFLPNQRLDLHALLFGDILAVSSSDVFVVWGGCLTILALLLWRWRALLTATLNPELANASGIKPRREQLLLTICIALLVAVALKAVGALLIASMLIIPAAGARSLVRTPETMAVVAALIAAVAVFAGVQSSLIWDTPTGPSIVCVSAVLFVAANAAAFLWMRWRRRS